MHNPLFTGPASLRDKGERLAFVLTLLFAFPAAGFLGLYIHESVGLSEVALFIVVAMIYVTLARGRLLGSSLRIHEAQHPEIFATVKRACAALEIAMPLIFVRDDPFVPVVALGFGEPYSLVFSSHWIGQFKEDELAFLVGRELGHIASGHTRYLSLLSVNGKENPIIAMIFGAWLRRCDITCDRIGLLVCGSLDAAMRALAISQFQHFGRSIDIDAFAEQAIELQNDAVLRWGEWLGSEPYATKRLGWLRTFMKTHSYQICEDWFLREVSAEPPSLPAPGVSQVIKADCASIWRRFAALAIDGVLIIGAFGALHTAPASAITVTTTDTPAPVISRASLKKQILDSVKPHVKATSTPSSDDEDDDKGTSKMPWLISMLFGSPEQVAQTMEAVKSALVAPVFCVYTVALVGLTGQTFGMMITGLRVVTVDYRRPHVVQTMWRYALVPISALWLACRLGLFSRIMLHDKWSKTRIITTERVMARVLKAS